MAASGIEAGDIMDAQIHLVLVVEGEPLVGVISSVNVVAPLSGSSSSVEANDLP